MFGNEKSGTLVPIAGTDPTRGPWIHSAFLPDPLPLESPVLSGPTHRAVADARASIAALDTTARQLPDPALFRRPTLRSEAQSTSALEGTYEPLARVLVADDRPEEPRMREVLNYETMAEDAFAAVREGRALTVPMLCELQATLVAGTALEGPTSGMIRPVQVVIGRRVGLPDSEFPIVAARFVPPPPGVDLQARVRDLMAWSGMDHRNRIDPVVAAAMAHYQFETLHPFHDGNGRIGRLLIVLHLYLSRTLSEPTLTVSPWFERRRDEYEDSPFEVSSRTDWDRWITLFARGIERSARDTRTQMLALLEVQASLKEQIRSSHLRADTAHALVDLAVARLTVSVRQVQSALGISYSRANTLVTSLVEIGVLRQLREGHSYNRRFYSPAVLRVILGADIDPTS